MISRLIELNREGGVSEVLRGIRDFTYLSPASRLFTLIYREKSLELGEIKIQFEIANTESLRRAIGHGEIPTLKKYASEIQSSDVVWDVGANQGTYSIIAALKGAEVHAFEPGSDMVSLAERNAKLNNVDDKITFHNVALGETNETMILRAAERPGVRWIAEEGDGEKVTVVRGEDVDAPSPDVIKIDVEGAEQQVLEGLGDKLDGCRSCFIEVHSQSSKEESPIQAKLQDAGYSTVWIQDDMIHAELDSPTDA